MAVRRIPPKDVLDALRQGQLRLLDIRQTHEQLTGMAEGSESAEPSQLEKYRPDADHRIGIALICQRGIRSARLAESMVRRGIQAVSVDGGIEAWQAADLPLTLPESGLNRVEHERYLRHLTLPQIGIQGQESLRRSRVLLIGAGGLGCPAAIYLAAAGIGHLGVVDDDRVELSNLQRQILHTSERIGQRKAESARSALSAINDQIEIKAHTVRIRSDNVDPLIIDYDLVIDGSDNFPTRYLINEACIRHRKPLIYGAVQQFSGQVSLFDPGDDDSGHRSSPCYGCLFPEPPPESDAPNCAQAGVLGVVPGVIGCLQANEAIKYLTGIGQTLRGRLLIFDALSSQFREVKLKPDPQCPFCQSAE